MTDNLTTGLPLLLSRARLSALETDLLPLLRPRGRTAPRAGLALGRLMAALWAAHQVLGAMFEGGEGEVLADGRWGFRAYFLSPTYPSPAAARRAMRKTLARLKADLLEAEDEAD